MLLVTSSSHSYYAHYVAMPITMDTMDFQVTENKPPL